MYCDALREIHSIYLMKCRTWEFLFKIWIIFCLPFWCTDVSFSCSSAVTSISFKNFVTCLFSVVLEDCAISQFYFPCRLIHSEDIQNRAIECYLDWNSPFTKFYHFHYSSCDEKWSTSYYMNGTYLLEDTAAVVIWYLPLQWTR